MTTVNLITIQEIKQYVDISDTLEPRYINKYISEAQINYVRGILGSDLYDELQQGYPDNLSYANIDLMPYIKKGLAYRFSQTYLIHEGIYNTPMGFREYTEDNSNPLSDRRRGVLIEDARRNAESSELDLQTFLSQNSANYPLWKNNCQPQVKRSFSISAVKQDRRRSDIPTLGTQKTLRRNP